MTRGKKADSDKPDRPLESGTEREIVILPRNILNTSIPAKLLAATVQSVKLPKHPIKMGNTVAGPNFFPSIAFSS